MLKVIKNWFQRYLSDPEAVMLLFILVIGFSVILTMGDILAPLIASIVIAYLLETWISLLEQVGIKRMPALFIVYISSLSVCLVVFFVLFPMVWRQMYSFANELPNLVENIKLNLLELEKTYPQYLSEDQIKNVLQSLLSDAHNWGKALLTKSLLSIPNVIASVVYLILVPLMVFFLLKDRETILQWILNYLPHRRAALTKIWADVHKELGGYIRGKMTEILIVFVVSYVVFAAFGLEYAMLLGLMVGISAIIPYVGAIVVIFPVVIVAYLQWGIGHELGYIIIAYITIQTLDGHLLVPLLFSEAVNLHPLAIVIATLVFGGLWGLWGLFFAIPLATLVKALINVWPSINSNVKLKG